MNERRRKLLDSWRRVSGVRFLGTDGVRQYTVERIAGAGDERVWRVLVDGAELVTESHRTPRRFAGCEPACWAAEQHAERMSDAEAVAGATPRQGEFSFIARADRRGRRT